MEKTDILIIGAGPYGIGLANELQHQGLDFRICGQPFSLWLKHTLDNLVLKTSWHTSEIFSRDHRFSVVNFLRTHYPRDWKKKLAAPVPIGLYREYIQTVLSEISFPVDESFVTQLENRDGHFLAVLDSGKKIEARQVIIATGIEPHRYLPDALCTLPRDKVIHSWYTNQYSDLQNKDIIVIGRGQSAGDAIQYLKEKSNRITWVLRHDPIFYAEPLNLPLPLFNLVLKISPWFYFLPSVAKSRFAKRFSLPTISPAIQSSLQSEGIIRLYEDAADMELELRNQKIYSREVQENYDVVIAATGYRYSLDNLRFLRPELSALIKSQDGIPWVDYNFETSVPGLFAIGGISEPSYGPAQRFMMGAYHSTFRLGKLFSRRLK